MSKGYVLYMLIVMGWNSGIVIFFLDLIFNKGYSAWWVLFMFIFISNFRSEKELKEGFKNEV